jgi:HEAT repeat protein
MFEKHRMKKALKGLGHRAPEIRTRSAQILGQIGCPEAIEVLRDFLGDDEPEVRLAAANSLAALGEDKWQDRVSGDDKDFARLSASGDSVALSPLLAGLKSHKEDTRRTAAWGLGDLGEKAAVDPLIDVLRSDSPCVQAAAARSLGELRAPAAVEPLLHALTGINDVVRAAAARGLGVLGDPRGVGTLIKILTGKSNPDVCLAAVEALGHLGDRQAARALEGLASHSDGAIRTAVATSLGQIGDNGAVHTLTEMLCDIPDVRVAAAASLASLGFPQWQKTICGDPCDFDRLRACDDPRAFEVLVFALSKGRPDASASAAAALGRTKDSRAVGPLLEALLNSRSPATVSLHIAVGGALAALGNAEGFTALAQILADADRDKGAVEAAVEALGATGDERAIDPLLEILSVWLSDTCPGRGIRIPVERVLSALAQLGDSRAVRPLIEVLTTKGLVLIDSAAHALGVLAGMGIEEAVDGLISVLQHPDPGRRKDRRAWRIRKAAAQALGGLATEHPACLTARWHQVKRSIESPHEDKHRDVYETCAPHGDEHSDVGIGLSFPEGPPKLGPADRDTLTLDCPNPSCRRQLRVSAKHAGKRGRCPNCGQIIRIPAVGHGLDGLPRPDF